MELPRQSPSWLPEPRRETPGRAQTAPLYPFFKGGSKCRDFLIFFRVLFWLGFWGFVFFWSFLPLSVRDGGGGNAHLYLNRDLFFSIRFFFPFFFSFTVFNPVLLTCLANTAMSSLKDSEEQTSPPATPGSLGVHVANSHFSKISAKRGNRGCLKENTIVTHTEGGKIS